MDPGEYAPILKKIRLGMLEPELQREVAELASELGYEATITAESNLHFLFRIYQAEREKEKRSARALKKAESLILRLSSLQHAIAKREEQRREKEKGKRMPRGAHGSAIEAGKRTISLLGTIGIEDEKVMGLAEELLGEKGVEERVVLVHSTILGNNLVRKFFSAHPEVILIPKNDDFVSELEAMEAKMEMVDSWSESHGRKAPAWADYNITPGILLDSFDDIARQLNIEIEAEERPESGVKYRGKPMDPDDFMKVVSAMGFAVVREATHGTLMRDGEGNIMCVQKAHRKQMELNTSTIKKKLVEAKVDLDGFEMKRRELKL